MKNRITVSDDMEITTVEKVIDGSIFLYPVTKRIQDAIKYRVLDVFVSKDGGRAQRFETEPCVVCDGGDPFIRNILCLNLDLETVVEYFLPDEKCMIGISD